MEKIILTKNDEKKWFKGYVSVKYRVLTQASELLEKGEDTVQILREDYGIIETLTKENISQYY